MNEIRKEKLRIASLVLEIMDRGIADMHISFSSYGYGVQVQILNVSEDRSSLSIGQTRATPGSRPIHPDLRKIRHDLEQMLKEGRAALIGRVGVAA